MATRWRHQGSVRGGVMAGDKLIDKAVKAEGLSSPFDMAVSQADRETLALVRAAIDARRVRLAFQPVVMSADIGRIAFSEGLVRVLDATGRIIPARDFMGAVERHEMGREIDCLALEQGLATLTRHPDLRISVNVSARSIGYPRWQRVLRKGLAGAPTVAERLILEIGEESAMTVPETLAAFMAEMQKEGVAFALDDFGGGTTALGRLRDFYFDFAKIDASAVRRIDRDAEVQALAAALVGVARAFGMVTVAVAVETAGEGEVLRSLGVDCLQGYLFGAPSLKPAWEEAGQRRA